jgi:hypothetical protein
MTRLIRISGTLLATRRVRIPREEVDTAGETRSHKFGSSTILVDWVLDGRVWRIVAARDGANGKEAAE